MINIFQILQRNGTPKEVRGDDNGRVATYPYQVRDLVCTGFSTLTRGTETTLLSGDTGKKIDVLTITGSNTSGIAQRIIFRSGTAGATMDTMVIPLGGTATKTYQVPLLQSEAGQAWTAQNTTQADVSDSPVDITIAAIKND